MLANRKLIIDVNCKVLKELKHLADANFYDLQKQDIAPGAIYLIGYNQVIKYTDYIIDLVANDIIKVIFSNPVEGSQTILNHCRNLGIIDLVKQRKILLLSGGDVALEYPHLTYDIFLTKVLDYNENIEAIEIYKSNYVTNRPYKFLFLNGQVRDHRKFMIEELNELLDTVIWSNLDAGNGPIKLLEQQYENPQFNVNFPITDKNVKSKLFGTGIWGDIILHPPRYNDTYFSLVTETVHTYPYSFRTEKIWKPIAIGHPWIAVANQGFYRDMHNLGFQTFGHVIDESFDAIENNHDRLKRVSEVVKDLCQQDLASFLNECYNVCKYNQQHLADLRIKVRSEFPKRFEQFVTTYINE
jgi:hypothetical protein